MKERAESKNEDKIRQTELNKIEIAKERDNRLFCIKILSYDKICFLYEM